MPISRVVRTWTIIFWSVGGCLAPAGAQTPHPRPAIADTLSTAQRCLIFYTPSAAQRNMFAKSRSSVLDSLSLRLDTTKRGIVPFLNKVGILSVTTDRMAFRFVSSDTAVHYRRKSRDLFGVIMFTPGRAPVVIRGTPTDVDLLRQMFPYYGIR